MQCMTIDELREVGLPSSLPNKTEMGVWKRSTGFEIVLPYRLGWFNWILLLAGYAVLLAAGIGVVMYFPSEQVVLRAVIYTIIALIVVVYSYFMLVKYSETHSTKIRLDLTPLTLSITRLNSSGYSKRLNEVPIREIKDICIDNRRGMRVNARIAAIPYGMWIGRGLKTDDLYYLACVIGQVTTLSAQGAGGVASDYLEL